MQESKPLLAGDHAALFYRNRVEQFAAVIPYLAYGLRQNERCLYIVAENTIKSVLDALEAEGVDVALEQKRGALTIATANDTYLKYGLFEPEKMIADLTREVERSLRNGFSAFRATGELMWAVNFPSALARVHEYEASLDIQFPNKFVALCQYNENCFSPQILSQMLRVHPIILARGQRLENPFYRQGTFSAAADLPLVTIEGLVDAVSKPHLARSR